MFQYANLEDTVYFWFASNDTAGSGNDGATAVADVRLAGATASDAPILSPTPSLLSHANYPAGCYEVAVAATDANGFAAGNVYAVFCTLAVDSQNPTGFVGAFSIVEDTPVGAGDGLWLLNTTIDTAPSQTSVTLTAGSADDGAYENCFAVITDATTATQKAVVRTNAYTGGTKTLTFLDTPDFTIASTDKIDIFAFPLQFASDGKVEADASSLLTTQMTESYASNGSEMTMAQAMYALQQHLMSFTISGVNYTVTQLDGETTAYVVTLNDATTPTGAARE